MRDCGVRLIRNPFLQIFPGTQRGRIISLMAVFPVRGKNLTTVLSRPGHPLWMPLRRLMKSDGIPAGLERKHVSALRELGILVAPRKAPREVLFRAPPGADLEGPVRFRKKDARELAATGRVVLRGLLPRDLASSLGAYIEERIKEGHLNFGDLQSKGRFYECNNPVVRLFHHRLTGAVSRLAGRKLKPSLSYISAYRSGAELPEHVDRHQLDWSISLTVFTRPAAARSWPLFMKKAASRERPVPVRLDVGDGVLYRGTQVSHFRRPLPAGRVYTSVVLSYVPLKFEGRLN
jgi:hypothetical protein